MTAGRLLWQAVAAGEGRPEASGSRLDGQRSAVTDEAEGLT